MVVAWDVFRTFPGAVVSGVYQLGKYQRGTVEGDAFTKVANLDVIVDEGDMGEIGMAPNAEALEADLLIYVKPEQLPTSNPRALTSGYMVYDSSEGDYFAIINAGLGKNQETGKLEHIELLLRQTEVTHEGRYSKYPVGPCQA